MTAYDVGDLAILTLTVPEGGSSTSATVTAWTKPDGTAAALPAATGTDGGAGKAWEAVTAQLDQAGEWTAEWTITGPGAAVEYHAVQVAPAPPGTARTYATTTDLADWLQAAPKPGAARKLAAATRVVDWHTRSAVYDVTGADEMPTDTTVRQAFREAVCAQVEAWQDNGTGPTGAGAAQWQTMTAGRISLGRAGGSATVPVNGGQLADEARIILGRAGLLGRPAQAW